MKQENLIITHSLVHIVHAELGSVLSRVLGIISTLHSLEKTLKVVCAEHDEISMSNKLTNSDLSSIYSSSLELADETHRLKNVLRRLKKQDA